MHGLRCPKCSLVNLLNADTCHRCGHIFSDLEQGSEVSVPIEETFQARGYTDKENQLFSQDNEIGRKTFFWYRIYCVCMLLLYVLVMVMGLAMVMFSGEVEASTSEQDAFITGIIYFVLGVVFAAVYGVALALPRKPYNWIYGIVMICIGLTSCCLLPATIPLFIFWLKPETKAYLGRN